MKDRLWLRALLAVGVGILVGLKVFHALTPNFAWVGCLVGAVIGYLAVAPIEALKAVPPAFSKAFEGFASYLSGVRTRSCLASRAFLLGALIAGWLVAVLWVMEGLLVISGVEPTLTLKGLTSITLYGISGFALILLLAMTLVQPYGTSDTPEEMAASILGLKKAIHVLNPLRVAFVYTPRALRALFAGIWNFCLEFMKFGMYLHRAIHSDLRTICFVDAGLSVLLFGYYDWNVALGAVVGGLFAAFNVEVVSKRWLGRVPAPVRVET